MQNRNPYAAPHTNVARGDDAEEYGEVKVFSAQRPHRPRALHRVLDGSFDSLRNRAWPSRPRWLSLADPTVAIRVTLRRAVPRRACRIAASPSRRGLSMKSRAVAVSVIGRAHGVDRRGRVRAARAERARHERQLQPCSTCRAAQIRVVTIATGLVHPWSIALLPDDRSMLVAERSGAIRLIRERRARRRAGVVGRG